MYFRSRGSSAQDQPNLNSFAASKKIRASCSRIPASRLVLEIFGLRCPSDLHSVAFDSFAIASSNTIRLISGDGISPGTWTPTLRVCTMLSQHGPVRLMTKYWLSTFAATSAGGVGR